MKGDTIIAALLCLGIALISEMSSNSSTKSSQSGSDSESDYVRVDGGRGINATALQGVKRIWAHSHNDEMQAVPLVRRFSSIFEAQIG